MHTYSIYCCAYDCFYVTSPTTSELQLMIQALRYQRELQKWEEENASPMDSYNESPIHAKSPIDANEYFGRWDSKSPSPVMQAMNGNAAMQAGNGGVPTGHGTTTNNLENRDLYDG